MSPLHPAVQPSVRKVASAPPERSGVPSARSESAHKQFCEERYYKMARDENWKIFSKCRHCARRLESVRGDASAPRKHSGVLSARSESTENISARRKTLETFCKKVHRFLSIANRVPKGTPAVQETLTSRAAMVLLRLQRLSSVTCAPAARHRALLPPLAH